MKLDEFRFVELLVASDLTDDQIEDVVEMFEQCHQPLSGKPIAKQLMFWIERRKTLLSDWRDPWSAYVHSERPKAGKPSPASDETPSQPPKPLSVDDKQRPTAGFLVSAQAFRDKWRAESEARAFAKEQERERARREAQIALLKAAPKPGGPLS
jgi:hypothetical protein